MTEPKADNKNETDLKIEKVISRGEGVNAQVLLVLVSSPRPAEPDDDIWVGLDRTNPTEIPTGDQSPVEAARPLTMAELELLDHDRSDGNAPFGLDNAGGRSHWLARFDFSDHAFFAWTWRNLVEGKNPQQPVVLDVVAWRSSLVRRQKVSVDDGKTVWSDVFIPRADPVRFPVPLSEIVVQRPFELGVLFVHGIGDHSVRETLVRWAEPIVQVWRDRGVAVERETVSSTPALERQRVAQWAGARQLCNRAPLDGISEVVGGIDTLSAAAGDLAPKPPLVRPAGAAPVTYCVSDRTEQTLFSGPTNEQPSATLLRLSTLDSNAVLRESHVLFAEAYWTRETFPPNWSELRYWLTTALPIAIWSRLHRLLWIRRAEIKKFGKEAVSTFERFRVSVSGLIWGVQLLVLPVAYVASGLAAQVAFGMFSILRLLPVPMLQRAIRWVVTALLGTLGQSFALQTSPIRRSAIVSAVTAKLNWIGDRCRHVVVVSHSQGAEVSRRAFQDARRDNVARWYTFGSGITPLNVLHPRSLDTDASRRVVRISKRVLIGTVVFVLAFTLDSIPGVSLGVGWIASRVFSIVGWPGLILGAFLCDLVILVAVYRGGSFGPEAKFNMRASVLPRWRDYFASEDPVPGGSFIDRFNNEVLAQYKAAEHRIYNARLSLLDHTSYWQNIEQFVAPIALDLLHLLGKGGHYIREKSALEGAFRRRDVRTWWNMFVSVLGLSACAISVLWTAFGLGQGVVWAEQARVAWSQGSGILKHVPPFWHGGFIGQVITDLWRPLLILPVLAGWWGVNHRLKLRSEKTLIQDLAAAARTPMPR